LSTLERVGSASIDLLHLPLLAGLPVRG